ncbi:MAG: TRAP transporter large permease [Burkholderiales bacterium]|nr:TRAP transporter large permease [Burkholderiales bacterium]
MSLGIFLGFLLLGVIGMPIAFSLGFAAMVALAFSDVGLAIIPQRMMHAVNSFPLMSIPFFILAGELMVKAGIVERLIELANAVVGRVRGGLAHVTMLSGAGLATVSGAAVSDASALSTILGPSLTRAYDKPFASAIIAAAGNLGPIIPPSGAMIVYAFMAGPSVSVGGMFMAGVVPGILITTGFMLLCTWYVGRRGYPATGDAFSFRNVFVQLRRSFIIFMMPVVVIGGIVGGAFTATEGSAIAVVYALVIGFAVTRRLRLADLPEILLRSAITTAMVGALIAFASVVTYILTVDLLPQQLATLVKSITSSPLGYMALVAVLLFVVGMFLESNAAYIMLVPLLHPIALQYGIDPLHFGFLFVLNLVIGMLTPPVGVVLFVVCGINKISMREIVVALWPFITLMYGVLVLCMLFPPVVTWLPRLLGYGA